MNHIRLEDKRTDYIADAVHLEGPIDFHRRDGIFRPLVNYLTANR